MRLSIRHSSFVNSSFLLCLVGYRLRCLINGFGIPKVIMPKRREIIIKFINQRNAGRYVQAHNLVIGNVVEIL